LNCLPIAAFHLVWQRARLRRAFTAEARRRRDAEGCNYSIFIMNLAAMQKGKGVDFLCT